MILCLEGASAVGKTICCRALQDSLGAAVIPEVNALFVRPPSAPEDWYLERQLERYALARAASETHPLAVLDGDPLQPLWYNWSFGFEDCQSLDHLRGFFRPLIASGAMGFPDRYCLLVADEATLRQRRGMDQTRSRRNFERHLRLTETLPRYFGAVAALAPFLVEVIEADGIEDSLARVQESMTSAQGMIAAKSLRLFDSLTDWTESDEPGPAARE